MTKLLDLIKSIFKSVTADDFFPSEFSCAVCDRELSGKTVICDDCAQKLPYNNSKTCAICGRHIDDGIAIACDTCTSYERFFDKAFSAFTYKDDVVALIKRYKTNHEVYLRDFFFLYMYKKLVESGEKIDVVAYVPMTKDEQKKRSFNQSKSLAELFANKLNLPLFDELTKVKSTKNQRGLTRRDRQTNVEKAFKASRKVKGMNVLVVDDVMTTGATLSETARALKKSGALRVVCVTIAST